MTPRPFPERNRQPSQEKWDATRGQAAKHEKAFIPERRKPSVLPGIVTAQPRYATPRAFIGAAALTIGDVGSESLTARAAMGFSHSNAMKAATKSQTIMAQKTLVQEPVLENNQAAPGPAKAAATPLAV